MAAGKSMRSQLKAKAKTCFDGYCPNCRENIGWEELAKQFEGLYFDPDRTPTARIVCEHCDSVLQITFLVDFQLTEIA